jgi:uracil-DNA glycosylase
MSTVSTGMPAVSMPMVSTQTKPVISGGMVTISPHTGIFFTFGENSSPVEPEPEPAQKEEEEFLADGRFESLERYHREHLSTTIAPPFKEDDVIVIDGKEITRRAEITQDMTVTDIIINRCPHGWENLFTQAWPELVQISNRLQSEEKVTGPFYPLKKDLFKVFELCPLSKVKVVIFGQDPYHSVDHDGLPTAQGMSFSVRRGSRIAPSLRTIYERLDKTVPGFVKPSHGDLTSWVKQGVFLVNVCLTVLPGKADSHGKEEYWMSFINKMIKALIAQNTNIVYMLWGNKAKNMAKYIGGNGHILESSHPSPLGMRYGFNKCNHFNEANDILQELGQEPINWHLPP